MCSKYTKIITCAVAMVLTTAQAFGKDKNEKTDNIIKQETHTYSVALGASRIIYSPSSRMAVLSVSNPNKYPMLVQSTVYTEQKKEDNEQFIITPPLFRLEPDQQNRLRIIMSNPPSNTDRETLYWMCVTGIPPENGDVWNKQNSDLKQTTLIDVRIKTSQCIKLLVRPESVKGKPQDYAASINWSYSNGKIIASNPTPFYININSLNINGVDIKDPQYIPPFGKHTYPASKETAGKVKWTLINDIGGVSGPFEAKIQ